jgi:hypothetical protein
MAVAMIVFINAAYQDGDEERRPGVVLRWTMRIAPFLIAALSLLTANTVLVLVLSHGWTPERIVAAAAALVVLTHGVGYAWAALGRGRFMARLEPTNILGAHLALAIGLLLLSPLADPARLSVADQLARLNGGKVAADKFDYNFLDHRADRFGRDALAALAKSSNVQIAERAKRASLLATGRPAPLTPAGKAELAADIATHVELYPAGAVLPPRFASTVLDKAPPFGTPECLHTIGQCVGALVDLDHDGKPELVLWQESGGAVFKEATDGSWTQVGTLQAFCKGIAEAIRAGQVSAKAPAMDDLNIGGARVQIFPPPTDSCQTIVWSQTQVGVGKPPGKP